MTDFGRRAAARLRRTVTGGSPVHRSIALVCVTALVVSGATATAASLITGKDVKNNSLTGKDIKRRSIQMSDLNRSLQRKIRAGLTNPVGTPNTPGAQGENGARGPQGPRGQAGQNGQNGQNGQPGQPGANGIDSTTPRPVTAANLRGWQLLPRGTNRDPSGNGVIGFAGGPAVPPLGTDSLRMKTDNGKNVSAIIPLREGNTKPTISELTTSSFWAYVNEQPQAGLGMTLKLVLNGSNACASGQTPGSCTPTQSGFTTLVFDPSNNAGKPGQPSTIAVDQWQRWNARGGHWFSSRPMSDGKCQNTGAGTCTIEDLVASTPNATIESARLEIGQNSGAAWPGFDSNVDDVRLGFDGDFVRYDLGG